MAARPKRRLEQLIARSTDIVVATDRKGTVVYYNDGASKILGYKPEEVLGHFVGQLYPDLDEAKRVMAAMRSARVRRRGHRARPSGPRFVSKSGERIPVAISGTMLYDDAGQEDGTIGFAKDLREILQQGPARDPRRGRDRPLARDQQPARRDPEPGGAARARHRAARRRAATARSRPSGSTRSAARSRASPRSSSGSARWRRGDRYETVEYVGPARMVDLRRRPRPPPHARPASRGRARARGRRRRRHPPDAGRDPRGRGLPRRDRRRRRRGARRRSRRAASTSCSPTS